MARSPLVLYWDTSALLSYFFADLHSAIAQKYVKIEGVHLLSSLAHAEACAVIARMAKQATVDHNFAKTIFTALERGPWRPLNGLPERKIVSKLSQQWSLRGADLWHLSLVVSLQKDLPEIKLVTFDNQLLEAAGGEGVAL
ncbi:MAG: hypothetical protein BWK76_23395 [Desulfobulbaceae bacterium A2]|nr:MAG: hypothetical protein BWK76_23395 [Desulfobulbaceae bacterium A2]